MIYANEWDPYVAEWSRCYLAHLGIAAEVDERSIVDVRADELRGFQQWHFFAGVAGWIEACRLAGWPEWRQICTISCPCQPFSKAGKGEGFDDPRDLWPDTLPLIRDLRPEVCVGEQVDGTAGNMWIDRTRTDLEGIGYAFGAKVLPALCVNSPTRRYRWWWIASRTPGGRKALERIAAVASSDGTRRQVGFVDQISGRDLRHQGQASGTDGIRNREWDQCRWVIGPDRDRRTGRLKARRLPESRLCQVGTGVLAGSPELRPILLAKGVPARAHKIRGYGNAIVPQVGAAVLRAYMEAEAE